jgi:RHS repeat-associated protein
MLAAWRVCARRVGHLLLSVARRRTRLYPVGLSGAAAAAVLALGVVPAANSGASTAAPGEAQAGVVRELSDLRTAHSDTYLRADGTQLTKVFLAPVNYKDSAGAWQPVETALRQAANGSAEAAATALPVSLPASLSAPVAVGDQSAGVSFSLQEGSGSLVSSGSSAHYENARPGVDVEYVEGAAALKETLSLSSASAPDVYRYKLATSGGLSAKLFHGAVVFSDAAGQPRYVMPTPLIADAAASGPPNAHAVHYELSEDGSELSVVVDRGWLSDPSRVFPVRIDPSITTVHAYNDCLIGSEEHENTDLCGAALYDGHETTPFKSTLRSLLQFELGSIPRDDVILSAHLGLYVRGAEGTKTVDVFPLTTKPAFTATWNTYDGTHPWTKAGGDFAESPEGKTVVSSAQKGTWVSWGVAPIVEKWVREPATNDGFLLKADNETELSLDEYETTYGTESRKPVLEVEISPRVGAPGDSTFVNQRLSDSSSMQINVANGNLLQQNNLFHLPGIGYDLAITQGYNTRNNIYGGSVGEGAMLSTGDDVSLKRTSWDESRIYRDPSGAWFRFDRNPAGDKAGVKAFTKPPGIDATLTEKSDGTATLEYRAARLKYEFDNDNVSNIKKIVDPNGNTTSLEYVEFNPTEKGNASITDTHGHKLTFTNNGTTHLVSNIADPLGRKWSFTENSSKQLTSIKNPDGKEVKYGYDAEGRVNEVTDPDGHLTVMSYDSTTRVSQIRHVINGTATTIGTKDVITTFAYSIPASAEAKCPTEAEGTLGDTEVVSPNGSPEGKVNSASTTHRTFYCFNTNDQVIKTIDQRGNPSTAAYEPGTGSLTEYQNPGDVAEGSGSGATNKIAYNGSGAPLEITTGVTSSVSLKSTLTYGGGTGNGGQVEPSSIQTPFSAAGQKGSSEKTHKTFYGYDASGNLTSINQDTETGKPEAKLTYNAQGQVTSSTDPDGNVTKYKYNEGAGHEKGELLKIEPPSPLGTTEVTYDAIDRVKTVKDGRGNTATYTYDGEDRVTKVEYSDGSSVSFKFDANGNTTERTDAKGFGEPYTGLTLYEYDKLNRPTLETTPTARSTRYGYDYDSNLTSLEDAGKAVTYAYGSDDVLTSLTEPENSTHPFKFGYQAQTDNRESTTYPNGLLQCTKTDRAGRLTSFIVFKPTGEQNCTSSITPSATLEDYTLGYTVEEETEGVKASIETPDLQVLKDLKSSKETTYQYDTLDRLLKATLTGSPSRVSEYKYDNAGDMEVNHTYAGETTYTNEHMKYNAANEICAIATTTPTECATGAEEGVAGHPTYDKDGNMTSDGLLSGAGKFAYTVRNQLSSVTPHGESAKQIVSHGTGQNDLAAIGSEEVVTNVLGVGVTNSGESGKYYTRGSEGTLLAKRTAKGKPSETEYFVLDPFGSVAMLTNASATQTAPSSGTYQYDPYGAPVGSSPPTFGYEGAFELAGGLLHFGARYLDPAVGQWTQQDPESGTGSLRQSALFSFAADDPINRSDPTGARPADANSTRSYEEREPIEYYIHSQRSRSKALAAGYHERYERGRFGSEVAEYPQSYDNPYADDTYYYRVTGIRIG